jgi:hypothetical protein
MPLFEIETESHIIITWAEDEDAAREVVKSSYPRESAIRLTRRPRDTWVISKAALGISNGFDPCSIARDCLAKAAGDKLRAIRLYMQETGTDLERARKVIESNMVMGW